MNPFYQYDFLKSNDSSFDYGSLIAVLSPAGHGKSLVINSMIVEYIKNNVDVLIFSENKEKVRKLYDTINFLHLKNSYENTGLLFVNGTNFFTEENYFINSLTNFLKTRLYKNRRFVIIFDCAINLEMFAKNIPDAIVCTRRVLIEKINQKSSFINLSSSMFIQDNFKRNILLTRKFREIANFFNSQIITTNNINKNFNEKENFNMFVREVIEHDIAFLVTKKEQEFKIITLKNRFNTDDNQSINCKINLDNFILEVKK